MKAAFFKLFTAGIFLFASGFAQSQSYENMPADVQKRMNENKQKGVHSLEGIKADYEFTITGVTNAATAANFEAFLKREFSLVYFKYNPSDNHVKFTLPAKYSMEEMKEKFRGAGYSFDLFFKENFHL